MKSKSVVVTGGGGSIGSELCRQLYKLGVKKLLILENSEIALYNILNALSQENVKGRLCDIRDVYKLNLLISEFEPDIIFHAAALKHVPFLEIDEDEGFKTNVEGTINVCSAALAYNVPLMVNVSSDKAVLPSTALGRTKKQAEDYCKTCNDFKKTRFVSVRFGNVANSSGSVIPRFRKQIEEGGPVTVTHKDATRYFMTIEEACHLMLKVTENPIHDIYVLDMGKPFNIYDLAVAMIEQSGKDVPIEIIGLRKNEKLHEELYTKNERLIKTEFEKILAVI